MDKPKSKIVTWIKKAGTVLLSHLAISAICFVTYRYTLQDSLGLELSFLNWVGILIITLSLTPSRLIKNDK